MIALITHVANSSADEFAKSVTDGVRVMQGRGYTVEVQYHTVTTHYAGIVYSTLHSAPPVSESRLFQ